MTTYAWEKKESAGSWVPFEGTPTAQNPTEDFEAGTWDVRVTVTEGAATSAKTRTGYVVVEEAAYEGPLDLVPGAVVAYWLWALSAARLGQPLFRLRRTSDDAESDFSADAVTGDCPVADIQTWMGESEHVYVVTFYDQSVSGVNLTSGASTDQPELLFNQLNGLPMLGDGSLGSFRFDSASTASFPDGAYTTVCLSKKLAELTCADQGSIVFKTGASSRITANDGTNGAGGFYDNALDTDTYRIWNGAWQFGTHSLKQNNAAVSESENADEGGAIGAITGYTAFSGGGEAGSFTAGVIAWSGLKSNGDRLSVDQNIAARYGITLS